MSQTTPTAPTNDNGPIAPEIASGVGATLREARQSTGQSVPQIAARLRIKPSYLQALEDNDNASLPGRVYAIGFLRSYATYLDLDPLDLIRRFKAAAEQNGDSPELKVLKPTPEQRQTPGAPAIAVSFFVVVAVLAGWYYLSGSSNPLTVRQVTVPETISAPAAALVPSPVINRPEPAVVPTAPTTPPTTAPTTVRAPDPEPEPEPEIVAAVQPAPAPAADRAPPPATASAATRVEEQIAVAPEAVAIPAPPSTTQTVTSSGAPRTFGQANKSARIVLTAKSDIWIQVRDAGGSDVFTRMLREGESYAVPDRPDLRLLTGNAGALAVTVDGAAAPALGDFGTILRDLPLDPEGLQ